MLDPLSMARPPGIAEFEAMYAGTPVWDLGRPQPAFVALAGAGGLYGSVLDVGCGTGEHALLAASLGLTATGADASSRAIDTARRKARERGLSASFEVCNALELQTLGKRFDVVLDSALFHVLDDHDRPGFVTSLGAVLRAGGRYYMLCFSELEPGRWGPRRIRQEEIQVAFADGWRIDAIEQARMDLNQQMRPARSWFCTIRRE